MATDTQMKDGYSSLEMVPGEILTGFDLRTLPGDFYDNPFPWYHRLRHDTPVREMPDGSILLTRHRDLDRVYRDTATFSSDKKVEFKPKFGDSPLFDHHTTSLVFSDPPLHTRVRKAIVGALAPRALAPLEPQVEGIVDGLLAEIDPGSVFEGVDQFAIHLPVEIISDMLCVPREERGPLRGWSLAILGPLAPHISDAAFELGNRSVRDFLDYLEVLVARKRSTMGDSDDDMLARLIRSVDDTDAALLHHELLHNCIFILNAGHETTTNLIASGMAMLTEMPEIVERLEREPKLWAQAVEEILRMESPNQLGNRRAVTGFELDGRTWPAGTQLTLCIGAANRDPEVFDDPDTFNLDRGRFTHFAFAGGAHLCAGLTVARIEARIALAKIFEAFPHMKVSGSFKHAHRARFRGFDELPLLAAG